MTRKRRIDQIPYDTPGGTYRKTDMSDDDIVKNIVGDYDVSEDYVRNMLHPAA